MDRLCASCLAVLVRCLVVRKFFALPCLALHAHPPPPHLTAARQKGASAASTPNLDCAFYIVASNPLANSRSLCSAVCTPFWPGLSPGSHRTAVNFTRYGTNFPPERISRFVALCHSIRLLPSSRLSESPESSLSFIQPFVPSPPIL